MSRSQATLDLYLEPFEDPVSSPLCSARPAELEHVGGRQGP